MTRRIESLPGDFAEDIDLFAKWSVSDREGLYWSTLDKSLGFLIIPDYVKVIPSYAFSNMYSLKTVIIANDDIVLEPSAFAGCENLYKVFITKAIPEIGTASHEGSPFLGCPSSVANVVLLS